MWPLSPPLHLTRCTTPTAGTWGPPEPCPLEWEWTPAEVQANPASAESLKWACEHGYAQVARLSLAAGADVNEPFANGLLPLAAVSRSDGVNVVEFVEILLECKAEVDAVWRGRAHPGDSGTGTALAEASWVGTADVVRTLLASKANVHVEDLEGRTALRRAATSWSVKEDVVRQLLDAGADVNARERFYDRTVLIDAGFYGRVGVLRALLDANADVNARSRLCQTALTQACSGVGGVSAVKVLLAAGARVNVVAGEPPLAGVDAANVPKPLHAALKNDTGAETFNVVSTLLNAKADVEARDDLGNTPLIMMVYIKDHVLAQTNIAALLKAGADPFATGRGGRTARQKAESRFGNKGHPVVEELRRAEEEWLRDAMDATGGPGPSGV